jgi:hypothetical protein
MHATEAINAPLADGVAPALSPSEARLQRNLKIIVIALAVLIFAGLAAMIGRVIYLASVKPAQPPPASLALAPQQGLHIPAGAQVRSMSLSGDRLAIHYEGGSAEGIVVLDLSTGQALARLPVQRGAPAPLAD